MREMLLGRVAPDSGSDPSSLAVNVRPQLGPKELIEVMQLMRPGQQLSRKRRIGDQIVESEMFDSRALSAERFNYSDCRAIPFVDSTMIIFDRAQASDEQAVLYASRIDQPLDARLASNIIPEMGTACSFFVQREQILTEVEASATAQLLAKALPKESRPRIRNLPEFFLRSLSLGIAKVSSKHAARLAETNTRAMEDADAYVDQFFRALGHIADPYHPAKTAIVSKTIGEGYIIEARLVNHEGNIGFNSIGSKRTKTIESDLATAGVKMPDGSVKGFTNGIDRMVIRDDSGRKPNVLQIIIGQDLSIFEPGALEMAPPSGSSPSLEPTLA